MRDLDIKNGRVWAFYYWLEEKRKVLSIKTKGLSFQRSYSSYSGNDVGKSTVSDIKRSMQKIKEDASTLDSQGVSTSQKKSD